MALSRFQFSLRTLLIVVTLLAIPIAYVGRQLNWISQRHEMLKPEHLVGSVPSREPRSAPGGLWLFGETGIKSLHVIEASLDQVDELKRLFPEAGIENIHMVAPIF